MTDPRRLLAAGSLVETPRRARRRYGPLVMVLLSLALWGGVAWLIVWAPL
jgi:hypothetical protein